MDQSNKDNRVKNPFASFRVLPKEQDGGSREKAPVRKVVLAPAKPVAAYKNDSKSAAVLSNFLRRGGSVNSERRQNTSGGGTKAVQVSLASLRRKSADARPFVDRSVLDECTNRNSGEERSVAPAPVEEINLVSSDDDEKDQRLGGQMEYEKVEYPCKERISTGVAIFDTVSDFEGSGDEEGYSHEEENEEDWHGDDAKDVILPVGNLHGLPDMVMVNGLMQPWWKRLSDFVPISELAGGINPRDGSQVTIDFASQFKGTSMPSPGSEKKRNQTKKKTSSQSKGYWISDENGEKCFVTPTGDTLRGRAGYVAYTRSRKSSSSAQRPRKRRKKAKKKSKK